MIRTFPAFYIQINLHNPIHHLLQFFLHILVEETLHVHVQGIIVYRTTEAVRVSDVFYKTQHSADDAAIKKRIVHIFHVF